MGFMTMELNQGFKMLYNFGGVMMSPSPKKFNTSIYFKRDEVTIVVFKC